MSQSTLCRELQRNSIAKGNYLWKRLIQALERRKRTTATKADSVLVWRINRLIVDHHGRPNNPRVLAKEAFPYPYRLFTNIINDDKSGVLRRHRRHPTSDEDQKANANHQSHQHIRTAQQHDSRRGRRKRFGDLRWILLLMPTAPIPVLLNA